MNHTINKSEFNLERIQPAQFSATVCFIGARERGIRTSASSCGRWKKIIRRGAATTYAF